MTLKISVWGSEDSKESELQFGFIRVNSNFVSSRVASRRLARVAQQDSSTTREYARKQLADLRISNPRGRGRGHGREFGNGEGISGMLAPLTPTDAHRRNMGLLTDEL